MVEELNKKIEGEKRTKSSSFILPMLGDNLTDFIDVQNCYIADTKFPELNHHIFVLFNYSVSKTFSQFEDSLTKHKCFIDYYDPNPKQVMFIFRVPTEWQTDYDLFKLAEPGKCYSAFKESYKQHIMNFLVPTFAVDGVREILYKEEKRFKELERDLGVKVPRTLEAYSLPDLEEETFKH